VDVPVLFSKSFAGIVYYNDWPNIAVIIDEFHHLEEVHRFPEEGGES